MTKKHRLLPAPRRTFSPVSAVLSGALAGAVGTAVFDAVNYVMYRAQGGEGGFVAWDFSAGLDSWDGAPAPAQVGKRLGEAVLARELPGSSARMVNNLTHWGYGMAWGAQYGLVAGSARAAKVRTGPVFGAVVWLSGYVVLPIMKLYQPIWEYDAKSLAMDLAPHLVYGTTTAATFATLDRRR